MGEVAEESAGEEVVAAWSVAGVTVLTVEVSFGGGGLFGYAGS